MSFFDNISNSIFFKHQFIYVILKYSVFEVQANFCLQKL